MSAEPTAPSEGQAPDTVRILVEAGNYFGDNDNLGDRAVYRTVVRRLRELWPSCAIHWITRDAKALQATCPDVSPLVLSEPRTPLELEPAARRRWSLAWPSRRRGVEAAENEGAARLAQAVSACDLVLAAGGGYFSDDFARHAWSVLDTLEAGMRLGKPALIMACGFEPIRDPALRAKMLAVLPRLRLIACREPLQSPDVVRSYGVEAQRVLVAADDAIEVAFALHPPALGDCLGVNLRVADYAGLDAGVVERLRAALPAALGARAAPVVTLPISTFGPSDPDAIRALLGDQAPADDGGGHGLAPEDVVRRAGRCRLVLAGSYHAAVFALSQGVSVVALAASPHYRAKLNGLRAQFGSACRVVALEREDTPGALAAALAEGWREAQTARAGLLQAAERQIAASHAAYERAGELAGLPALRRGGARSVSPIGVALRVSDRGREGSHVAAPTTAAPGRHALSRSEIETFREQGFVGPFTAFDAGAMERVRQVIYERVLSTPTPHCPFGLRVRHLDSRTVYDLCAAPEIVGRMASLFGPDLVLWNSNLFDKPPTVPGCEEEYPWHQDHYNWSLEPMLNVSAWLAIGPATRENGCVEVIPGSHRQIVPPVKDTDPRLSLRFGGIASDPAYVDATKKIALPLEPGQFFLFNERLLHHSQPNLTQERRLGLAVRVTVPLVAVREPFPCVLLSGRDELGFNRYVDPPSSEPDAEWLASLPPGHSFVFDRPIPGMGWHLPENDGRQRFAWTGLKPEAWIDFRPVGSGDHVLRCDVVHMLSPRTAETVRLRVNGRALQHARRRRGDGLVLEALVPEAVLQARGDRVRVELCVQELARPCDLNPASPDKRTLGLGVGSISLAPAAVTAHVPQPVA